MKELCELNNIKLVCYFSPMKDRKVVVNTTKYTIINHSDKLKNELYFYDIIHVNYKGRQVSSEYFANAFKALLK